jgi:hypothetical protein
MGGINSRYMVSGYAFCGEERWHSESGRESAVKETHQQIFMHKRLPRHLGVSCRCYRDTVEGAVAEEQSPTRQSHYKGNGEDSLGGRSGGRKIRSGTGLVCGTWSSDAGGRSTGFRIPFNALRTTDPTRAFWDEQDLGSQRRA